MIGLVRHIEYLLLHNDDVFIPGLGRFTVLCDEAKIQSGGTSFLPPVRLLPKRSNLFINTWSKVAIMVSGGWDDWS